MEKEKKTSYKYCIVPKCTSTTIKTPEKLFFNVPRVDKIREKWCIAMKRGDVKLSESSRLYCCEDHFNVEQDMKNYWRYRVMGSVAQVKLKTGVVPHIFECQQSSQDITPEWNESEKRRFIKEVLGTVPSLTSGSGVSREEVDVMTESTPTYEDTKEKIYCRLCLKPTNKNLSVALCVDEFNYPENAFKKAKFEVQEILKMLNFCLPFFVDTLTFNPFICTVCLEKLKVSYEFANECFRNQQRIEKYAETCGIAGKIVDIVEVIESKFTLSEDEISSATKTLAPTPNIPKDPRIRSWQQKKCIYSDEDNTVGKKQKICHEPQNENSLTGSNQVIADVKIEPDSDDSSAFKEFLVHDRLRREANEPNNVKEDVLIKMESTYIDSPDFVKIEVEDDLHVKNELCNERADFGTDIDLDGQPSHFHGTGSVAENTDISSIARQEVFSNVSSNLDPIISDVIK